MLLKRMAIFLLFCTFGTGCTRTNNVENETSQQTPTQVEKKSGDKAVAERYLPKTPEDEDWLQYSLMIARVLDGYEEAIFDNDAELDGFSGGIGGDVVVYVNDSPIRLQTQGSSVISIYDFVEPGKNVIRFEGEHTALMCAKVVLLRPKEFNTSRKFTEVVSKAWLDPSETSVTLEFDARITEQPDYEELAADDESRAKQREEILAFLNGLVDDCNHHDAKAFIERTLPSVSSPPVYFKNAERARHDESFIVNVIAWPGYHLDTKAEDVQMIFGKRSVLLYTEIRRQQRDAYLFRFTGDEVSPAVFPTFYIARYQGKWRVVGG
jgi:hypothetical protein